MQRSCFAPAVWGLTLALAALLAPVSHAADVKLTGDNTKIKFVGSKPDGKHEGGFKKLSGEFAADDDVTRSKLSVTIDVDSLFTDNEKLTGHLKSPDFFDVKRFPTAKFVSTGIKSDKDGYVVTGDLTLHGKTKSLSFPAKISAKGSAVSLSSKFELNRSDWDITYGKGMIDEAVQLTIDVQAK